MLYEDDVCPCGCGWPRSKAWDEDTEGWWSAEQVVCFARAALEQHEKSAGKNREPGSLAYVTLDTPEPIREQLRAEAEAAHEPIRSNTGE